MQLDDRPILLNCTPEISRVELSPTEFTTGVVMFEYLLVVSPTTEEVKWTGDCHSSDSPDSGGVQLTKRRGQGGNRTPDTRIFSPLLYQLSYLSIK